MVVSFNPTEILAGPGELADVVARRLAVLVKSILAGQPVCSLALSGGTTPRLCYERLAGETLDWTRIQVFLCDERCLPAGDSGRNDRMVRAALLDRVLVPDANVHVIPAERGARSAAVCYAFALEPVLPLDLVLLGMGEDGHTASLFPGNASLHGQGSVLPVFDAPKPPSHRVTLSLPVLNAARYKLFLVSGVQKHAALEMMKRGVHLPAGEVKGAEWYLDQAAWFG